MESIQSGDKQHLADLRSVLGLRYPRKETTVPRARSIGVLVCSLLSIMRAFDMAVYIEGDETRRSGVAVHPKCSLPNDKGLTTVRICV